MISLLESLRIAFHALTSNKLRAVLTTLGVVIGISFVLLMGWFIAGLNSVLEDTLDIFGDDVLYVDKADWTGANWMSQRNRPNITYTQFLELKERLRLPQYVVPTARRTANSIRFGDLELVSTLVMGTTAEYVATIGGAIDEGRFFSETEELAGAPVAVVGPGVVDALFPGADPVGRVIKVEGIPMTIIGTLPKRGGLAAGDIDQMVIVPLRRYFSLYGAQSRIVVNVKAGGTERLEEVRFETEGAMRDVRGIAPGEDSDFAINTQEAFRQQLDVLRSVVFGVGISMSGLAFVVGSIGIMNIMFVSVTERTREIGIRKALGATRASILMQFLIESVMLCLIGAVVGLILTQLVAVGVKSAVDIEFLSYVIPPSQIVLGIVVSVVVGVLAGVIPARRAAWMNPVDALRSE